MPPSKRTRGAGSYTESQFWGFIREGLREKHQRWKPRRLAVQEATRDIPPERKQPGCRRRKETQCAICKEWGPQDSRQADHIEPVGSLRCYEDLPGFTKRLFVEMDGYRVLCKPCHKAETAKMVKKARLS